MSKVYNHLHKYKKVNIARKRSTTEYYVYKCQIINCPHYVPLSVAEGRACQCNRCGEPMMITKETLTHSGGKPMLAPHCNNCIKRKKSDDVAALAEVIEGMLGSAK